MIEKLLFPAETNSRVPTFSIHPSTVMIERCINERKRGVVSGRACTLVTVALKGTSAEYRHRVSQYLHVLFSSIRRTDCIGWIDEGKTIGVLFTAVDVSQQSHLNELFEKKLRDAGFASEVLTLEHSRPDQSSTFGLSTRSGVEPFDGVDEGREGTAFLRYCRDRVEHRADSRETPMSSSQVYDARVTSPKALVRVKTVAARAERQQRTATTHSGSVVLAQTRGATEEPGAQKHGNSSEKEAGLGNLKNPDAFNWRVELERIRGAVSTRTDPVGGREIQQYIKRAVDVAISLVAILMLFPVLCAIACGVRLSSPGPILFRQKRVGKDGKEFTFLKFRSMKHGNDASVHEKFVTDLIALEAGAAGDQLSSTPKSAYKMVNDSRITRFGTFIRKTSLDELPQLWNVIQGQMSLVGPRPPIPYEVDRYAPWHLERLMHVKPGITGLWQVEGRSRVSFNEMVRMDIRYARNVNLWTDLHLMVRTVSVVLKMTGAR
jgi:lipopolysaccharide/colanic/teichoic acid biosynthesis glycosyltransferase